MLDTVWRVSEKDFDATKFCDRYEIKNIENLFIQGEEGRRGKINEESGFNVLVSENTIAKENIDEVEKFIRTNSGALNYLRLSGISSVIDIGCTVGTSEQFTKSVNVPTSLLGLLNQYGICIEFSAYPAADEENEA